MKKLLVVFSLVIITSCSSNDAESGYYYPPSWIQGTWKESSSGDLLKFSKSDIIYTSISGNSTVSFSKDSYKFPTSSVQLIASTGDNYIFDYFQFKEAVPVRFNFVKTSNSMIKSTGFLPGNFVRQ
jgi:hypothetical protein